MKSERIYFSRYFLKSAGGLNAASERCEYEGALIRVGAGFGCLHPWPELGDPRLDECLAALRVDERPAIVSRTLDCAKIDGLARENGVSLFNDLNIPRSHGTVTKLSMNEIEAALAAGFMTLKAKVGRDWPFEKLILKEAASKFPDLRWRLDFNFRGDFWELLDDDLKWLKLDFLEDPFPFDETIWQNFQGKAKINLALDRSDLATKIPTVRVIKPAIQNTQKMAAQAWKNGQRVVLTSYLDHPLGQCFSAFEAGMTAREGDVDLCGLQTHGAYKMNGFSERLGRPMPEISPPRGLGLGFDDLLEKLEWKELK